MILHECSINIVAFGTLKNQKRKRRWYFEKNRENYTLTGQEGEEAEGGEEAEEKEEEVPPRTVFRSVFFLCACSGSSGVSRARCSTRGRGRPFERFKRKKNVVGRRRRRRRRRSALEFCLALCRSVLCVHAAVLAVPRVHGAAAFLDVCERSWCFENRQLERTLHAEKANATGSARRRRRRRQLRFLLLGSPCSMTWKLAVSLARTVDQKA